MAYFRCIANGGASLTVECDEALAGQTITCTDGVRTYSLTCPSSSPYEVKFKIPEEGTWTVSTTLSGTTYSKEVEIEIDYTTELNAGFVWKNWMSAGGVTGFTSLSDLLASQSSIRRLMTIHASVDYMCESTSVNADLATVINDNYVAKWASLSDYAYDKMEANNAILDEMEDSGKYGYGEYGVIDDTTNPVTWGFKGNIPVMTSDTAPYGEASSNRAYTGYDAYKAFDNDDTTSWQPYTSSETSKLYYKFTNPINPKKALLKINASLSSTQSIRLIASNDGTTWDYVSALISEVLATNEIEITTSNYYLYLGVEVVHTARTGISTLQFYGRELKVSVPTMTSNTAPYGEAFRSSIYNNLSQFEAWKAFDNDSSNSQWACAQGDNDIGVGFDFGANVAIYMIGMLQQNATNYAPKLKMQVYEDNAWADASNEVNYTYHSGVVDYFAITPTKTGSKWRVHPTELSGINMGIFTLQFYGKDYSEKEWDTYYPRHYLYDHGVLVDCEEMSTANGWTAYNGSDAGTFSAPTFNSNDVVFNASSSGQSSGIGTTIDTTNYSNAFFVADGLIVANNTYAAIQANTAKDNSSTRRIALATLGYVPKSNLDLSSTNQNCYLMFYSSNIRASRLKEMWLE